MGLAGNRLMSAVWLVAAFGCCWPTAASSARQASHPGEHDLQAAAFDQTLSDAADDPLPAELRRQVVDYPSSERPGTIVIDTPHTFLYYVLGNNQAIRYGVGVGRQGFTWSGVQKVSRKATWPSWAPPPEMIKRQQYLPHWVAGGPDNPLGARALYLGDTEYRIHGTNDPSTIGQSMSSGCIRLTNQDIIDLYDRTGIGTKVVVLTGTPGEGTVSTDDRQATSRRSTVRRAAAHSVTRHRLAQHLRRPREQGTQTAALPTGRTASSTASGWH